MWCMGTWSPERSDLGAQAVALSSQTDRGSQVKCKRGNGDWNQACGARCRGLGAQAALPSSGKVGPVGNHGLGDSPVLGPVAQGGGEGLPKDVLDVIRVVSPHPFGVGGHPRGVGEHVAVGFGTPGEGRGDHPGWPGAHLGPPSVGMGSGGSHGGSRERSGETPPDS